jgi:YD repeat-containing protein
LEYDEAWRRRALWLGASAPGARDGAARIAYGYDEQGRLSELRTTKSGGESIAHFQYAYDAQGRRRRADLLH